MYKGEKVDFTWATAWATAQATARATSSQPASQQLKGRGCAKGHWGCAPCALCRNITEPTDGLFLDPPT
eukprot:SAG25_NODE_5413_length_661_cov_1.183274_1_plen_68_part_10